MSGQLDGDFDLESRFTVASLNFRDLGNDLACAFIGFRPEEGGEADYFVVSRKGNDYWIQGNRVSLC